MEKPKKDHLLGVNSIRFLMALWVVLSHYGPLPFLKAEDAHGLHKMLNALAAILINGPAAVIVFFLVSGLCIHFPHRRETAVRDIRSYYTRRLVRIFLPLLVAAPLNILAGYHRGDGSSKAIQLGVDLLNGILWSVIAEVVYYLLYPLLLRLKGQFGWKTLIAVSYAIAYSLMFCIDRSSNKNYPAFGLHLSWFSGPGLTSDVLNGIFGLNWAVGLPCWLLGCLIAQEADTLPAVSNLQIWLWRLGLIASSSLTNILRFHTHPHLPGHLSTAFPETLNLFAIMVFFWLRAELAYYKDKSRKPIALLEAAGAFSYSLYMMHFAAGYVWEELVHIGSGKAVANIAWFFMVGFALLTAYIFYLLVEKPSHQLAVRLSRQTAAAHAQRLSAASATAVSSQDSVRS